MAGPKVSVIIPTHNRIGMIGDTIENMERQTLRPHEIIVVDDGSTDGSAEYLQGFGERIRLIIQENRGPGAARNAGLAIATGDYVQFFDSDDLCTLNKIEGQVRALEASGADIAHGPWAQVWFEESRVTLDRMIVQQEPTTPDALSAFLRGWVCLIPCCVIRLDLLIRLGGYPTAARTAEDLELFFRALVMGARLVHVPDSLVLVRQHPGNQISASPDGEAMRFRDRARLIRLINAKLADRPDLAGWVDRLSWRVIAWEALRNENKVNGAPDSKFLADRVLRLIIRASQVRGGLRKRLTGSRLPRSFGCGKIKPNQEAGIRALGCTPLRR